MGDGPPGFRRNSSCSAVLRILLGAFQISSTGFLPSLTDFSKSFDYLKELPYWSPTTPMSKLIGLGFSRFARRYSGNRIFFLFLQDLMFQFSASTSNALCIHANVTSYKRCWVPPFGNLWIIAYVQLPKHIGVSPVLHRLLVPRHPPCALIHLTLSTLRLGFDLSSSDRSPIKKISN